MRRRISGSLTSSEVTGSAREDQAATVGARARQRSERERARRLQSWFTKLGPEALFLFERGPLTLVAGEGFEPSTSGL
jgi:hypothetical protein